MVLEIIHYMIILFMNHVYCLLIEFSLFLSRYIYFIIPIVRRRKDSSIRTFFLAYLIYVSFPYTEYRMMMMMMTYLFRF